MEVFVTGGTGALGGHVIPALVGAGHGVRALARTREKAARLEAQGATPVRVSLFDRAALTEAFGDCEAVANLASALPPTRRFLSERAWRENHRVRTEGSTAVVDAAMAAGVRRVVQESVSMIYPDRGAEWIDESVPADSFPRARSNLAAEANAERFARSGGAGVVLRFGMFYGPGAAHSEEMFAMARRHVGTVLGPPDGYISSIHMTDAASAVVAALNVPAGTYNVVEDEPVTKREYARAMARAAATRPWISGPGRAALLFGERLTSMTRSLRVSNRRFRDAADWAPLYPSVREGWAATAAVLAPAKPR
ncbi:NAD-dependent epimerase/dehydratase family protein [Spirillospora sp. NPDC050679]